MANVAIIWKANGVLKDVIRMGILFQFAHLMEQITGSFRACVCFGSIIAKTTMVSHTHTYNVRAN